MRDISLVHANWSAHVVIDASAYFPLFEFFTKLSDISIIFALLANRSRSANLVRRTAGI